MPLNIPLDTYDPEVIYTYHSSGKDDLDKYLSIRDSAKRFSSMLTMLVPPGRERSIARTRLEEVVMWANAGIARQPARDAPRAPPEPPQQASGERPAGAFDQRIHQS